MYNYMYIYIYVYVNRPSRAFPPYSLFQSLCRDFEALCRDFRTNEEIPAQACEIPAQTWKSLIMRRGSVSLIHGKLHAWENQATQCAS